MREQGRTHTFGKQTRAEQGGRGIDILLQVCGRAAMLTRTGRCANVRHAFIHFHGIMFHHTASMQACQNDSLESAYLKRVCAARGQGDVSARPGVALRGARRRPLNQPLAPLQVTLHLCCARCPPATQPMCHSLHVSSHIQSCLVVSMQHAAICADPKASLVLKTWYVSPEL